jgi:hypothetical protein
VALSLSSAREAYADIAGARDVTLGTYVLRTGSPVQQALLQAAHHHAHVEVTLQRDPYRTDKAARLNTEAARELRHAGVRVRLLNLARTAFHIKAAVCDGVAYLDDRNWPKKGPQTVLKDRAPRDVALLRAALTGNPPRSCRAFALRKDDALARETALIRHAGRATVVVESENIGRSPVADALREHAARGARTVLILGDWRGRSPAESRLIENLRAEGVEVHETGRNEKLALVGDRAWIGSANATGAFDERTASQTDWGTVTRAKELVGAVKHALRRDGARDAIAPP